MLKFNLKKITTFWFTIFCFIPLQAQNYGSPLIVNYTPKDYGGHNQVWTITEDNRGVMYFGTTTEILENDGQNWRRIYLPNKSNVRSLLRAGSGTIYVGGSGEIGYLKADSHGQIVYQSLVSLIDSADAEFPDTWEIFETQEGIYFRNTTKLFRYNEKTKTIKVWHPKTRFNPITVVPGIGLIVRDGDKFYKMKNDELLEVPQPIKYNGEFIYRYFPYSNGKMICVTAHKLLMYDFLAPQGTDPLTDFQTDVDTTFLNTRLYMGCVVGDSAYAITSLTAGIFIINKQGKLIERINQDDGLQYNHVWITYLSSQGILWIGLDKGISRADYASNIRYWGKMNGFDETINSVYREGNILYCATMNGVFQIPLNVNSKPQKVEGLSYNAWYFNPFNFATVHKLLIATSQGLAEIEKNKVNIFSEVSYNYYTLQSKYNPQIVFATSLNEVIAFNFKNGKFVPIDTIKFLGQSIRCFEDADTNLWITSYFDGMYRVKLNPTKINIFEDKTIEKYDTLKGFKDLRQIKPFLYNKQTYFLTLSGLFKYNKKTDKVELTNDFGAFLASDKSDLGSYCQFGNKHYFAYKSRLISITKNGKDITVDSTSNNIIANKSIAYITVDSNQDLYTCGFDGVYMIKNIKDERFKNPFPAIIRKVTINEDTTVFWGTWSDSSGLFSNIQPKDSILKVRYNQRNITFCYSCPVFYGDANVVFSYKLEGYDKNWSAWSNETTNKYTNLHEGTYTFQVKAKNIYGIESQTAGYKFIILAPWYRTYWAYAGYILILILLIYFIVKINSRRLKKQNLQLEQMVKERTAQISAQNEELMQQREEIMAQRDELSKINQELEKLSIVASETDNSIFIINPSGDFLWANDAFTRLYGYTFEEFTKYTKNLFDYYVDKEFSDNLKKQLLVDKKSYVYESNIISKEGKEIWLQTTITPIIDDFGEIKLIAAVEADISKIKKYEEEIQTQNASLREKNDFIESSIRYARTIQQAILPQKSALDKYFDNLIIYRPKDVVSGDFYWFVEKDEYIFFAVADCTGHGVPGAFMSLISSRILSSIIVEKNIFEPDEVLNELDKQIISSLNSKETNIQDGMDIAFCRFKKINYGFEVNYSGAKRSLYYYTIENNQLKRIQGAARAIGGFGGLTKTMSFGNTKITAKKGDVLYMYSDGFTDQNNFDRRKYTSARLTKVLEEIGNKDIEYQSNYINNDLDTWQNSEQQRDDITFIGLKIK